MALIDISTALNSAPLRNRCEGAILKHSKYIATESRSIPYHDERRALALRVLTGGISWGDWQRYVVSDSVVINNAADVSVLTDEQIESLILTIWNYVAGIAPADVA